MTAMLKAVGDVVTMVFSMVGTVATTIAGTVTNGDATTLKNPVLVLFCVAVPLCGLGVGMFKRLLSARG